MTLFGILLLMLSIGMAVGWTHWAKHAETVPAADDVLYVTETTGDSVTVKRLRSTGGGITAIGYILAGVVLIAAVAPQMAAAVFSDDGFVVDTVTRFTEWAARLWITIDIGPFFFPLHIGVILMCAGFVFAAIAAKGRPLAWVVCAVQCVILIAINVAMYRMSEHMAAPILHIG
jgi:hypothetical protein